VRHTHFGQLSAGLRVAEVAKDWPNRHLGPEDQPEAAVVGTIHGLHPFPAVLGGARGGPTVQILSVSLYGLIGYVKTDRRGIEAALKYLVIGGAGSATLLFGGALAYSELGTLDLGLMARTLSNGPDLLVARVGIGLAFVG
jgi:hypothetical protein